VAPMTGRIPMLTRMGLFSSLALCNASSPQDTNQQDCAHAAKGMAALSE
jgi:hypothetical protein